MVERRSLGRSEPLDCQILFVSQSEEQRLPQLLQQLPSAGV